MTVLYLDFGNTRIKWCLGAGSKPTSAGPPGVQEYAGFDEWLLQLKEKAGIESVVYASVLGDSRQAALTETLHRCVKGAVKRCVVSREALGVACAYEDVSRLGIDRWLAVLAVWHRERRACVVADLGTAATLDVVDNAGQHQGGYIVSGLELSLRGLLAGTDNIRPDPSGFDAATLAPGANTAAAIYNGALHALVALIQSSYQNLLKSAPEAKLILAGGDAPLVGSHISCPHQLVEGLVFEGMWLLEQAGLLIEA